MQHCKAHMDVYAVTTQEAVRHCNACLCITCRLGNESLYEAAHSCFATIIIILLVEENHCIYLYLLQKIQLFPDTECGMLGVLMDELQQAHMYAVAAKFSNDSVKMLLIGLLKIGLFKKKCYLYCMDADLLTYGIFSGLLQNGATPHS